MPLKIHHILIGTAVLFFFTTSIFIFTFVVDDAFISLLYARNLVRYGELVANFGERCFGFSSFLFVIIEAGLIKAFQGVFHGYEIIVPVKIFLLICAGLCLLLPWRFTSLRDQPTAATFWLISLCSATPFIIWTSGGMETIFLALLLLIATIFFLKIQISFTAETSYLEILMLLTLMAAVLTRLDAVLIGVPLVFIVGLKYKWSERQWWIRFLSCLVLPIVVVELFNYWYYGAFLPQSFHVKSFKAGRSIFTVGFLHFFEFLFFVNLNIIHLVLIIIGIKKVYVSNYDKASEDGEKLRAYIPVVVGIGLYIIYIISQGYVHMMFAYRFYTPLIPLFYMASALSINLLIKDRSNLWLSPKIVFGFLSGLLIINIASFAYAYNYDMTFSFLGLERQHTNMSIKGYTKMMSHFRETGETIKERFPQDTKMYCWSGGIIPYCADIYAFDDTLIATRETSKLHFSKNNIFDSFDLVVTPYQPIADKNFEVWRKIPQTMDKKTTSYYDSPGPHFIYISARRGHPKQ